VRTLHELQDAGVEPDVWKVQGLDRREDCVNLVAAARRGDRSRVGCIIQEFHGVRNVFSFHDLWRLKQWTHGVDALARRGRQPPFGHELLR
jgi:hypothetical protein